MRPIDRASYSLPGYTCVAHKCTQELEYAEDPDDGLMWMDKMECFDHFFNFYVCKADTNGKRGPTPISNTKRNARQTQRGITRFDKVPGPTFTSGTRFHVIINVTISRCFGQ